MQKKRNVNQLRLDRIMKQIGGSIVAGEVPRKLREAFDELAEMLDAGVLVLKSDNNAARRLERKRAVHKPRKVGAYGRKELA